MGYLQSDGKYIEKEKADELLNFVARNILGLKMEVIQKGIFDGILDEINVFSKNDGTGEQSVAAKCRLLWLVFIHTHPKPYHSGKVGQQGRSPDELNKDILLGYIRL